MPSKILRRPHQGHHDPGRASPNVQAGQSAQSMKEREEDYHRARERIIGPAAGEPAADGIPPGTAGPNGMLGGGGGGGGPSRSSGRGGGGAGQAPYPGRDGGAGRGRGRKAVFRDKDREMQDPDYARR